MFPFQITGRPDYNGGHQNKRKPSEKPLENIRHTRLKIQTPIIIPTEKKKLGLSEQESFQIPPENMVKFKIQKKLSLSEQIPPEKMVQFKIQKKLDLPEQELFQIPPEKMVKGDGGAPSVEDLTISHMECLENETP